MRSADSRYPNKRLMSFPVFRSVTLETKFYFEIESIPSLLQTRQIKEALTRASVNLFAGLAKTGRMSEYWAKTGKKLFCLLLRPDKKASRGAMQRIHA
jgi:hypothetical protein